MGSEVVGFDENYSKQYGSMSGGKRKSKSKRSNGHKDTCACPICKNMMKKGKKGGVLLVGGTLPEAAQKLREAADALEDKKNNDDVEDPATVKGTDAAPAPATGTDTAAAEKKDSDDSDDMDVDGDSMGGGRRRSSKRGKGKKSKKGGKSYYYGGKKSKKSKKSKKRGRKSRRY